MAKQTQLRRGTAAEQAAFAGAIGEVSVNTTNNRLAVHNGSKLGGFPAIHENGDNGLDLTLTGNANLTAKNITLKDSTLGSNILIGSSGIRFIEDGQTRHVLNGGTHYIFDYLGYTILSLGDRKAYDDANEETINWDLKTLTRYDGTRVSLDWGSMALYDNLVYASVDWDNRQLYNAGGTVITLDWNNNTLWRNNGGIQQIALNWSGCELRDKNGFLSEHWNDRQLIKSDGSSVVVDWENNILGRSDGRHHDWEEGYFYVNNKITLNTNGIMNSQDELVSIDWDSRDLYDSNSFGNFKSLDWDNRSLYRTGGLIESLNWNNQTLNDGSTITLDWKNKILSGNWTGTRLASMEKLTVGLTDSDALLHVKGTGKAPTAVFTNLQNYGVYVGSETASSTGGMIQATQYGVGNNINLAIQPLGGKVSIGHYSPNYQLDVLGTGKFTDVFIDNKLVSYSRTLSGLWTIESGGFTSRPTVNGVGVLLIGEDAGSVDSTYIVKTTGNQLITGIKTFSNLTNFPSGISGNASVFNILGQGLINLNAPTGINILSNNGIVNLSGASGINLNASNNYSININTYGTGRANFLSRPTVSGNGIITYNDSPVFLTGSQVISGDKTFANMVKVGSANVVVVSGNQTISGIKTFTNPIIIGTASVLLSTGNQTMLGNKTFNQLNISGGQFRVGNSQPRGAFDIKTEIPETPTLYVTKVLGGDYFDDTNLITFSIAAFKSVNNVKYFSPFGTGNFQETSQADYYHLDLTWSAISGADGYRIVGDNDYAHVWVGDYYYDIGNVTGLSNIGNGSESLFTFNSSPKPNISGGSFYMDSAGASHIYSPTSNQLSIGYSTGSKAVLSISNGGNLDISLSGSSSTRYIKVNSPTVFSSTLTISGNPPNTSVSAGIRNTIAISGGYLYVATGTNQWGRVALSNW